MKDEPFEKDIWLDHVDTNKGLKIKFLYTDNGGE